MLFRYSYAAKVCAKNKSLCYRYVIFRLNTIVFIYSVKTILSNNYMSIFKSPYICNKQIQYIISVQ